MGWADIGSQVTRSRAAQAATGKTFVGARASVGFVPPTLIYDQMRSIEAASVALLGDYQRNVSPTDPMRQAYENWRTNVWLPFFTKHTSTFGKLSNVLDTDTLMAQTEARSNELEGFRRQYTTLVTPGGTPVPPPTGPSVAPPPPIPNAPTPAPSWWPSFLPKVEVPWWAWVLGGAALVGGGYLAVKAWKRTHEEVGRQRQEVFRMLPALMGAPAIAHDASPSCQCEQCQGG
jgi:hypothetical protein